MVWPAPANWPGGATGCAAAALLGLIAQKLDQPAKRVRATSDRVRLPPGPVLALDVQSEESREQFQTLPTSTGEVPAMPQVKCPYCQKALQIREQYLGTL